MRSLVTGGQGFLGSHLVDRLVARGDEVVSLDDLSSGTDWTNPEAFYLHGRVEEFAWHTVIPRCDAIWHLASPASPPQFYERPIETAVTSAEGTHRMLELARLWGASFVFASTSEVYGDPMEHPQREKYTGNVDLTGPRAVYDEGKRYAEMLVHTYRRTHRLNTKVARIFNTYGPRMASTDGRVVTNFIAAALRGDPLPIYGDGEQTRSLCYVDDLIEGLILLGESPQRGPINIGNPYHEWSVNRLAMEISRLCEVPHRTQYHELPNGDPKVRRPDITAAVTLLGWEPVVPLIDGLARTIAWHRENS